ncbi:MAG TPA: CoA activase [Firmicutes bacterium]|nr:CoA activase [Bacillota bacterium]
MKIADVIDKKFIPALTNDKVLGIDIGSRTGKAVLLADGNVYTAITPTAVFTQETADKLFNKLLKDTGLKKSDIQYIVGTGYGRISLDFGDISHKIVTEISCHAMGAHALNTNVRSIVDIGGQDSKAIRVDPRNGKVIEFIMNDKCAAGTGRFLEKVAQLLDLTTEELGNEALQATKPSDISSQCVVFAESEVISLKAKGEKRADIAAGIHVATARRVRNLFNRIGLEPDLVFSGGVSNNVGMKKAIEQVLGHAISEVKMDTIYAGALGAAVLAQKSLAAEGGQEVAASAS